MPPTPGWTIAELRPHTSATSRRMTPSSRLSRERRWSRRSRLRGGQSPAIRIRGPSIGSSRRIALSMTPRLLALPGSGPLSSCINGLIKRSRCLGAERPCLIRCPRSSSVPPRSGATRVNQLECQSVNHYYTWRYTDGSLVEYRPLAAVRRDYRHARKRPARLSQHALEWTPLERPLRPPSATGIRSILVYHPSHTLLAPLVSHRPTLRIPSPPPLHLG